MKYIQAIDLKPSCIALGCMRLSSLSQKEADEFIHGAVEFGINLFDHADIYGHGECERIFGRILQADPSLRSHIILQSKCAIHDGMFDFSRDYILRSVEGILERLRQIIWIRCCCTVRMH